MVEQQVNNQSKIVLTNGQDLSISSVTQFDSALDNIVSLQINGKNFVVEGNGLKVTKLDTENGELYLTGNIETMRFEKQKSSKFSFKNIFKG